MSSTLRAAAVQFQHFPGDKGANLAIIDSALAEAQRAVMSDPGNAYLQTHLADVMRRKVMLLQRAATLASAET